MGSQGQGMRTGINRTELRLTAKANRCHSLIKSSNILLSSCCFIPGTVLDTEDTEMKAVAPALKLRTAPREAE